MRRPPLPDLPRTNVAFDLRWVATDQGGIRSHALNLFRTLLASAQNEFRLHGIVHSDEAEQLVRDHLGTDLDWQPIRVGSGHYSPASQLRLAGDLQARRIEILHTPEFLGMLLSSRLKTIITVHDLIPYLHPELCARSRKVKFMPVYRRVLRRLVATADRIIVISQATETDLTRLFPSCAERVRVIYHGIESAFFEPVPAAESVRTDYRVSGPLVLSVGRRVPNKNLVNLIRAIDILHHQGRDMTLLLVGPGDPRYPEPEQAVRDLGLSAQVHFTGFTDLNRLRQLYQAADVFVFPSLYEGFGAPPAEAMASGTPVIVSDRSSLPEVVGDAGLLVDPEKPGSIAEAIQRILDNAGLRRELSNRGRERARRFTWEAATLGVLEVYRELRSSPRNKSR